MEKRLTSKLDALIYGFLIDMGILYKVIIHSYWQRYWYPGWTWDR